MAVQSRYPVLVSVALICVRACVRACMRVVLVYLRYILRPQSGKSAMDLVPAPHSWSELQLSKFCLRTALAVHHVAICITNAHTARSAKY